MAAAAPVQPRSAARVGHCLRRLLVAVQGDSGLQQQPLAVQQEALQQPQSRLACWMRPSLSDNKKEEGKKKKTDAKETEKKPQHTQDKLKQT